MHHQSKTVTILLALLLLLLAAPARAQEESGDLTLTVRAGFDGAYRANNWVPVTVRAANNGSDVEGRLRVVVGRGPGEDIVFTQPISLPNRSDKRATLYVHVPGADSRLTVELVDQQGRVLQEAESNRLNRVAEGETLYGVVSSEPGVWLFLEEAGVQGADATAAILELEELPEAGAAWEALDVLILNNVDGSRFTPAQLDALRGWVGLGGQLVITGGANWQQTAAPFQDLLPVAVDGVDSMPDLPALEQRAGVEFRDPGPYLVTQSTLRSGEVLLAERDVPLLASRPLGRGAVVFLALDPTLAPLLDWRGSQLIWSEIAAGAPTEPSWAGGPRNPYSAHSALTSLPALQLPSILGLLLFLGVYIAVVGPANYIVLNRLDRRELAWVTIPGLVVLFSALAYAGGFRLRGNDVIINQMSIAYGDAAGSQARTSTLLGIFSPRRATYDVQLPADALVRPFSRNFGEMTGSGSEKAISSGSNVVLEDVRVDVSGIETYIADSYQPLPAIEGRAELRLDGSDARLDVEVQNNGDFVLEKAGVLVGNSFISLGDLQPGDRVTRGQALTGSSTPGVTGASSSFPTGQPLSAHYHELLGTGDFYSDREVNARFQLLESTQQYTGPPRPMSNNNLPQGVVTLIGWSQQPQLEITLPNLNEEVQQQSTTLHFLELPIENVVASGSGVRVPPTLFDYQVDSDSFGYFSSLTDFYLPPGRLDITFTPWPAFQAMDVQSLQISLHSSGGDPTPELHLWDWDRQAWLQVPNAVWGNINIAGYEQFIGENNALRLRLNNNTSREISVGDVYPVLTGDVE